MVGCLGVGLLRSGGRGAGAWGNRGGERGQGFGLRRGVNLMRSQGGKVWKRDASGQG